MANPVESASGGNHGFLASSDHDLEFADHSAVAADHPAVSPLDRRTERLRLLLAQARHPWLPALPPPTARNLWLLLAALVALQNCTVFHAAQMDSFTLLAVVLWGGALICIEDQIEAMRPRPGWIGLLLGTPLLLWVLARTAVIVSMDNMLFMLAPMGGIALTLLCQPLRRFALFRDALLCLSLLPVSRILGLVLPEQPMSLFTAKFAGFWLAILGLNVLVDGRRVILPGGSVEVFNSCNGYEIIVQLMCISAVFLLAYPVRSLLSRAILVVAAPIMALFSNSIRIALLAIFTGIGSGAGKSLFRFFHDDAGSLIFAGIAVFVYGALYLNLLEYELAPVAAPGAAAAEEG